VTFDQTKGSSANRAASAQRKHAATCSKDRVLWLTISMVTQSAAATAQEIFHVVDGDCVIWYVTPPTEN
jgi:hypothetical protein